MSSQGDSVRYNKLSVREALYESPNGISLRKLADRMGAQSSAVRSYLLILEQEGCAFRMLSEKGKVRWFPKSE